MKTRGNQVRNRPVKGNGGNAGRPNIVRCIDTNLAQERLRDGSPRVAPAYYIGRQKGTKGIEDFDLYHLTEEIAGFVQGSTVSGKILKAAGFQLPPRVRNPDHERVMAQIRRLK